MKILITGGAGFIGSAVVQAAVSKGNFVINLDALKYLMESNVTCQRLTFISLYVRHGINEKHLLGAY